MTPEILREGLEKALKRGGEGDTLQDLELALAAGSALLWIGERSGLVTTRHGYDLHVWLGCGDLRELKSIAPGVFAHARAIGCTDITIEGRRGWDRVLRDLGFVRDGDELRKRL